MDDQQLRDFLYELLGALGRENNLIAVSVATAKIQCELAKLNGRRDAALMLGKVERREDDGELLFMAVR